MNELADRKTRADAEFEILRASPGAYPITFGDSRVFDDLSSDIKNKAFKAGGLVGVCASLDEISKKYGVPLDELKQSVEIYNQGVKAGKDAFNKPVELLKGQGIEKPPFYVLRLAPKLHHTMGGLKINEKAQVIHAKTNEPIPGLYAAGDLV